MELYVLGSESDTSGRVGSADGRLGCQQQQLVHPVVTSSLCELHSAEGLPTGFRPTKGCVVIAEQNRLSLLCACMRACFFCFFSQHFTSKQTIACVAFESTSQYRLVFTQSKTTPPKTTPPVLMAANHRANQHATKKTQVIVGNVPPRPHTLGRHRCHPPHPPPQRRFNSPSWPSRSYRRSGGCHEYSHRTPVLGRRTWMLK